MDFISLCGLFFIFFYVGLFSVGGGLVSMSLMQEILVSKNLVSAEEFYRMVAISEATPGPIGINIATYAGFNLYGIKGGIIAAAGQVMPSLLCILIIAGFFKSFKKNKIVESAFSVIRPAATSLIFIAAVKIVLISLINLPQSYAGLLNSSARYELFNWPEISFYILSIAIIKKNKIHPIFIVTAGALFGILFL